MSLSRKALPAVLAMLLASLALSAAVQAQPVDRTVQLDEQLEQQIENAVVYVSVEYTKPNSSRTYIESGSGFFVAPGQLITNHHVVAAGLSAASAKIQVRTFSGSNQSRFYPAEVIKTDPRVDLALLQVQGDLPPIKPVQIAPELPAKQSEVFAFGFPLGTMLDRSQNGPNVCLRRGYVSRMINDGANIEADINIDKGISGGPLVDENGVVCGVVRAMVGSDYNKAYAGISVASPVLLAFCSNAGCRITLRGGQVVEPGTQVSMPTEVGMAPDPRPRAGLGEDLLRAFFTVGSALRLTTLVPQMLASREAVYSSDIRQTSRDNAAQVLAGLRQVQAPEELVRRTQELDRLISQPTNEARLIGEKAAVLEQACDEWVSEVRAEEKLNYDLGAWLTELSLGLLDVGEGRDLRSCSYFLDAAGREGAKPEVMVMLRRLQTGLNGFKRKSSDDLRRTISKDADRLIGVGYLATGA